MDSEVEKDQNRGNKDHDNKQNGMPSKRLIREDSLTRFIAESIHNLSTNQVAPPAKTQ